MTNPTDPGRETDDEQPLDDEFEAEGDTGSADDSADDAYEVESDADGGDDEPAGSAPGTTDDTGLTAAERRMSPSERRAAKLARSHGAFVAVDPALRIRDRASSAFVLIALLFFVGVFANAIAFGHGGALSPTPSPTPIPTATPTPSATPAPSETPVPSGTAVPSGSPTASGTPAASADPSATVDPSASAAPSASPAGSASPAPSGT